jgi:uncharacterized RDD family membrane protein YckC
MSLFPIRTPEGVVLEFRLAGIELRLMAFVLDMMIVFGVNMLVGVFVLIGIATFEFTGWLAAAYMAFFFLFRLLYFIVLEMRGRGQTPGKKVMGIRVVDSHGTPLTGSATFLRNVSRDVELFLPLVVVLAPEALLPGAPWWFMVFPLVWVLLLGLFPLISPLNLRPGDVIAGTVVVIQPRLELRDDLFKTSGPLAFSLSAGQLEMYGIQELQLLEKILRDFPTSQTLQALAAKIAAKMDIPDVNWVGNPESFLKNTYAQLRAHHEQRILFGDRQLEKREGHYDRNSDA